VIETGGKKIPFSKKKLVASARKYSNSTHMHQSFFFKKKVKLTNKYYRHFMLKE
jgi:hypothetical protein